MNLKARNLNNKEFFARKADGYDDVHEKFMTTKNTVTDSLDENTVKVLDLGAGTGLELIHLFERFPQANVTVVDITQEMLDKIKERDFADRVNIVCGDFFEVDFGKDYDAVISTSALHHFVKEDKYRLYKKIFECLKENGQFINSDYIVNTKEEEKERYEFFLENFDKVAHCDTPLCIDNEKDILSKSGFRELEVNDSKDVERYKLVKCRK